MLKSFRRSSGCRIDFGLLTAPRGIVRSSGNSVVYLHFRQYFINAVIQPRIFCKVFFASFFE